MQINCNTDRPYLLVVIDTEEEFNWNEPFARENNQTSHLKSVDGWQKYFNQYDVKPCYVIDYPVATQQEYMSQFLEYHMSGKAEIGAHLHPWVNPPFTESVNRFNSYPGNLPYELEKEKLTVLTNTLSSQMKGDRPVSYKAGRYGIGKNTLDIMSNLGYEIDLSVCPAFDFSADGGVDHSKRNGHVSISHHGIYSFPLSADFVGWGGCLKRPMFNLAGGLDVFKARGIMARSRFCDRLRLSPEGFTTKEHKMLVKSLYEKGMRVFSWTFHSPSFMQGFTPYVRDRKEALEFKKKFDDFFDFFINEMGGVPITPKQLKKELSR